MLAAFALALALPFPSATAAPGDWDLVREYLVRERANGARYVADELLIGLEPGADRVRFFAALKERGASPAGEYSFVNVVRVVLPPEQDPLLVAASWAELPGVLYAEPNDVGEGGSLLPSNDTFFGSQWHLENTGQSGGTPGADIEIQPAWAAQQAPQAIVLAILDSGIDFAHPEFVGRVVAGWDYVNEDPDATADHPHGIWCAGLAAANTDNAFGVAGVDKTATIYPIKVLDQNNGGTVADLVQGLAHCAANQLDVVSMSLINYGRGTTLENALIGARNAGCILIACAGNGGIGNADVSGPGQSAQTISIGATTRTDARASFSGTGAKLDFVAPGSGVITVTTAHTNGSTSFSGCSAATPVAAGVVALLLSQDPTLSQAQIYDLLRDGAEDLVGSVGEDTPGRDDYMGWGRINAWRSLDAWQSCPFPTNYGFGKFSSLGTVPVIGTDGTASLASNSFELTIDSAVPNALSVVIHGPSAASVPFMGGTLLVGGQIKRLPAQLLDAQSHASSPFDIDAGLVGTTRYFQGWFRDIAQLDGTGVGLTDGLEVTFCP